MGVSRLYYQLLGIVIVLMLGFPLVANEKTPEWVQKLPSNQWTKIDQGKSGNRKGASVTWLPKEEKLVLVGGLIGASNRESKKPNKMIYSAVQNTWEEYKDEPQISVKSIIKVTDSTKKLIISIQLPLGFESLAGDIISNNTPLTNTSKIFSVNLAGETVFLDPFNKEIHLIGGALGSAEKGSIGNWVYSIEKNMWEPSKGCTKEVKEFRNQMKDAYDYQKDTVAFARNIFYAVLTESEVQKKVKEEISVRQNNTIKVLNELINKLEKICLPGGIDATSCTKALAKLKAALAKTTNASNIFLTGVLTAPEIAEMESASWLIDEANELLASEPTSRTNAMGVFAPDNKTFVLHGGDHGDYMLTDTWHYDMTKRKWQRIHSVKAPSARFGGQMYWVSQSKKIALLSGKTYLHRMKYQSFSSNIEPDVWLYDPVKMSWEMLVKPGLEIQEKSPDNMPWFIVNNSVVMTQYGVLICPAAGGNEYHDFLTSSTWMLKLDTNSVDASLTEKLGVIGGERVYRSQFVEAYNPTWYDSAPKYKSTEIDKLIASMPVNQWVEMPIAARPCPERSWGTSIYDPDRDQVYFWTGGHCADPADIVHHFHPGTNNWSIPYIAGGITLGNQFSGRPDCQNHTYKNYAYDPVSKMVVAAHRAGTHVYDPNRRDWSGYTDQQPFLYNPYSNKCLSTPMGVVAWAGGCTDGANNGVFFQLFDAKSLKWNPLAVNGEKIPPNVHGDEGGLTWDSKRKLIYINAAAAYSKANGKIYQYNPNTKELAILDPKNRDSIGDKFFTYRETVYLPEVDLVLFGMGFLNNRQVAYDPAANKWVLTTITKTAAKATFDTNKNEWVFQAPKPNQYVGSITFCPSLDTRRNVLWAPSDYKSMFVLKIDPKTILPAEEQNK